MRIIILSPKKAGAGGVERFSAYLTDALAHDGHTVTVRGAEDLGRMAQRMLAWSRYAGLAQPMLGWLLGRKALTEGFDVCVTNGLLGWNIRSKKTLNIQHGTFARAAERIDRGRHFFKYVIKRYIWGGFEGLAARRAAQCVAVSEETKESVERYYRAQAIVIGNAVDTERFAPGDREAARAACDVAQDEKIVLFVGRFEYAKGSSIMASLEDMLRAERIRLVVAEHYSDEALVAWYQAADIFILPSLHEGSSYALLEAMSAGLPFAASPVGLVREFAARNMFAQCIVHEQTAGAYMSRIQALLSLSPDARRTLTEAERAYIVKAHSLSAFRAAYAALVQHLS